LLKAWHKIAYPVIPFFSLAQDVAQDIVFQRLCFRTASQCLAPYLVLATTHLGKAIIIEAEPDFPEEGIPPPTPAWGNMLTDSVTSLVLHW
jgi:hypothetical protein